VKTTLKVVGIFLALALLGLVMAYQAGFFVPKIPVDFKGVVPSAMSGREVVVEKRSEPLIEEAAGTLRAKVETVISPLITATISSITVWSGDGVKEGDVLVKLDARELKARVDQAHQAVVAAQARLTQAEKDSQRIERILRADAGAVSKAERDRADAALESARADLLRFKRQEDEARTAMSYSRLTAPIAGRIVERYADPGDTARSGEPLLRMYDPGTLRLEASVRETVASMLQKGQRLRVDIDAVNRQFEAVVDEIVPSADPGSRSFLVKVSLAGGSHLYPGMFGRLLIPIGSSEKIYIPQAAVTTVGQLNFVIVKTEPGPARRYVRLGERAPGNKIEIISGLAPGDRIIVADASL
jgi:RND family efflux transporter MFP subunit